MRARYNQWEIAISSPTLVFLSLQELQAANIAVLLGYIG
jgi:hypothetical protein